MLVALRGATRVLLSGPTAPDGDSIGACLALARVLRGNGVPDVVVAGDLPRRYRGLPDSESLVRDSRLAGPFDAVVILDGDRHRLPPRVARAFTAATLRGIVDHHASTTADGYTHAWLEPECESTCGMLLRALPRWGVPLDRPLAALLYTGLVFDTGGFRHANTTPVTHRLAADLLATGLDPAPIALQVLAERTPEALAVMGAVLAAATHHELSGTGRLTLGRVTHDAYARAEGDLEGVVDALVATLGTEVGALLIERAPGSGKYSLRSRGARNMAQLARQLHPTGGGHPRAAGASFRGSLDDAERTLLAALHCGGESAGASST